jgi:hypothetical protein
MCIEQASKNLLELWSRFETTRLESTAYNRWQGVDGLSTAHCQPGHTLAVDRLSGDAGHAARWRAATGAIVRVDSTGRTESRGGDPTAPQRSLGNDHSDELTTNVVVASA